MTAPLLLGTFIVNYITLITWVPYLMLMDPISINIMATDATKEHVIVQIPEMTFPTYIDEYTVDISNIRVDDIRKILKEEHGLCFSKELDDQSYVDITINRNEEPFSYQSTANGVYHLPAEGIWEEQDLIRIRKGNPPQPYKYITGIDAFELPLTTFPCPTEA